MGRGEERDELEFEERGELGTRGEAGEAGEAGEEGGTGRRGRRGRGERGGRGGRGWGKEEEGEEAEEREEGLLVFLHRFVMSVPLQQHHRARPSFLCFGFPDFPNLVRGQVARRAYGDNRGGAGGWRQLLLSSIRPSAESIFSGWKSGRAPR